MISTSEKLSGLLGLANLVACCQSERQMLLDIIDDHGLEQMILFPTRDENTLDLILTSLPGPSCSNLTMSLVNDWLKFTLSDTQIC